MNNLTRLRKTFKQFVATHRDVETPAFLGNIEGTVKADVNSNVYVVLQNGEELTVRNNRVPLVPRLPVIIGYDASNPTLLQVLRARDIFINSPYPDIPNHADATHQWPKHDVLWVRGEQFLPGLAVPSAGLTVQLMGFVYNLNGWHSLDNQTIDFTAEIPTTGAKYLLVEVDDAGAITFNAGAAVDSREMLTYEDIPAVSSVNKMPLFAIKVYPGQASILKSRLYTDIIDLRWSGYSTASGVAGSLNWDDLIDVPLVFPPDTSYTDPLYVRKFDSVVDPTVDDDISIGYLKNDLWHNTVSRSYFLCHDNANGAADWFALGQGGGDASFVVDGALAVFASSAANVIVFTKDMAIENWYFYIEDKGSAGTTILDVHYLIGGSGTIFTTQANRPSIAYNAGSNLMVATPDITQFLAGDVLELQIDSVATGAMSLVLIGNIAGSGGSGGNVVTVDDGASSVTVGNILFVGASVTDDGGGQATVTISAVPSADTPPSSPDTMDDEFGGSSLDGKWTIVGGGTFTIALSNGFLRITQAAVNERLKGVEQSISGTSWRFRTHAFINSRSSDYIGTGLFVRDSASGKVNWFGVMFHSSFGFYAPYAMGLTNVDTFATETAVAAWTMGQHWYLELEYDGTNFYFRHSADGYNFCELITYAKATYLGADPTHVGIAVHHYGPAIDGTFGWFRRMA